LELLPSLIFLLLMHPRTEKIDSQDLTEESDVTTPLMVPPPPSSNPVATAGGSERYRLFTGSSVLGRTDLDTMKQNNDPIASSQNVMTNGDGDVMGVAGVTAATASAKTTVTMSSSSGVGLVVGNSSSSTTPSSNGSDAKQQQIHETSALLKTNNAGDGFTQNAASTTIGGYGSVSVSLSPNVGTSITTPGQGTGDSTVSPL
jgi:hypothetical protein